MRISDWSSDVCSCDLNFAGPMRLREAMVTSRNLASVRLLDAIGVNYARRFIPQFGFPAQSLQIGRQSCRERGCQYESVSVAAVSLTKTGDSAQQHERNELSTNYKAHKHNYTNT